MKKLMKVAATAAAIGALAIVTPTAAQAKGTTWQGIHNAKPAGTTWQR